MFQQWKEKLIFDLEMEKGKIDTLFEKVISAVFISFLVLAVSLFWIIIS
ncbi:hypothetical protein [Bacillus sp. 2205SS5-2]